MPARVRSILALPALASTLSALAWMLTSASCSSPESTSSSNAASNDAAVDALDDAQAAIAIPATTGSWQAASDVTVTGRGTGELGAISLVHGVGTIEFHGAPAQALLFVGTDVPLGTDAGAADSALANEHDFEIVAEQDGRLIAAWLTCYQGALSYVYYETTDGIASQKSQTAQGTCTVGSAPTSETPAWPAFTVAAPSLVSGFTIAGADVAYDGAHPGTIALDGATWSLHPFHVIDCTACAAQGWWELHSLLWNPAAQRACLGILYLTPSKPSSIELAYLLCLPDVTSPIPYDQKQYAATFTHP